MSITNCAHNSLQPKFSNFNTTHSNSNGQNLSWFINQCRPNENPYKKIANEIDNRSQNGAYILGTTIRSLYDNIFARPTTPAIEKFSNDQCWLNILSGRHREDSNTYQCSKSSIACFSTDPTEQSQFDQMRQSENIDHLLFSAPGNFDLNFIDSLPFTKIRIINVEGFSLYNKHTISFIKDVDQTIDALILLASKQEILFFFSGIGGTIHHKLTFVQGKSILVTFSPKEGSSWAQMEDEIIEYITRLSKRDLSPKEILMHVISRFPVTIGITMPEKESLFLGGNFQAWDDDAVNKNLALARDYLEVDITLSEKELIRNDYRRNCLRFFEPLSYLASEPDESPLRDTLLAKLESCNRKMLNGFKLAQGLTPLHIVLEYSLESRRQMPNKYAFIEKWLDYWISTKANLNGIEERFGETALHRALKFRESSFAKMLIDAGANIHLLDKNKQSPLHVAIINGNREITHRLIDMGADIHSCNDEGKTPLYLALSRSDLKTAEKLIAKQVNLHAVSNYGSSLLHLAVSNDYIDIAKILIENKVSINRKMNFSGITPLHLVKSVEMADLLIKAGADVNAKATEGYTPAHMAAGNSEILRLLAKRGANLNLIDNEGMGILHMAAKSGSVSSVRFLIDIGLKAFLQDYQGRTPLKIARIYGYFDDIVGEFIL